MNLIFEGADCVGKTSIINEFIKNEDKDFKIFHFKKPPEKLNNYDAKCFQKDMFFLHSEYLLNDDNVIFDRFHIGEIIYGSMYRNYKIDYIKELEEWIKDNCLLIYVTCDDDVLIDRFDHKGLPSKNYKVDLPKINALFKTCCDMSNLKNITIDTTNKSSLQSYKEVKNALKRFQ